MEGCTLFMGTTVLSRDVWPVRSFAHELTEYGLPIDEDELARLDLNHHKYTVLQGDKLFLAPISPTPQKILDIGTGTGIPLFHRIVPRCLPISRDICDRYCGYVPIRNCN